MIRDQSGNVLFYILVAVALLAALAYAVSQGSRTTTSGLSAEQARLQAAAIIEYGNALSQAVTQLKLRGYKETDISFENSVVSGYTNADCSEDACRVFALDGGGVSWQSVPENAMASTSSEWRIGAQMAVKDIGTTCTSASCSELLAFALDIKPAVCEQINTRLGLASPEVTPVDADADYAKFTGSYSYVSTIGGVAGSADLAGRSAGCFFSTADNIYIYYQVLIAR